MTNSIGLYYPYIHFRDEAWLKVSALYWDTMTRIVPSDYRTHDSDTVRDWAITSINALHEPLAAVVPRAKKPGLLSRMDRGAGSS